MFFLIFCHGLCCIMLQCWMSILNMARVFNNVVYKSNPCKQKALQLQTALSTRFPTYLFLVTSLHCHLSMISSRHSTSTKYRDALPPAQSVSAFITLLTGLPPALAQCYNKVWRELWLCNTTLLLLCSFLKYYIKRDKELKQLVSDRLNA